MDSNQALSQPIHSDVPVLEVEDLRVDFKDKRGKWTPVVDGVTFSVKSGQTSGLVGESGSGKSVTALAVMGLHNPRSTRVTGTIRINGQQIVGMSERKLERLRGATVAMIFQDPMTSLNPLVTVGLQITETLKAHRGLKGQAAVAEAIELLDGVGIPEPQRRVNEYPHQLSGGMRQRVMIAIALACKPELLIADEPTTALDVTIQAQILDLLKGLVKRFDVSLVLITHDLGVVAGICDDVNVMYAGRIVESADRYQFFARPIHPYTNGLLASVPRLDVTDGEPLTPIPGSPNDRIPWTAGCAFSPRCTRVLSACWTSAPDLEPVNGESAHIVSCFNPSMVSTGSAEGR